MIKKLIVISILFIPVLCFCQQTIPLDSLLNAVDNEKADSNKIKIYNQLADYYMDNNAGKAIEYLEKSKDIANKLGLKLKEGDNYYSLGFCYLVKADFEKSLYNYQQSTFIYEKLKDSRRLANAYMSIGNVYFQNKDTVKTDLYYDKAEKIIIERKDTLQLSSMYDTRGITYDQLGKFDLALSYFRKAYNLAYAVHEADYYMNTLSNIGLTYKHQFKTAEALKCFDSVLVFSIKTGRANDQLASIYNNIAATNAQAGDYPDALQAFTKSIQYAKAAGSPGIEMENYHNISDMYGTMKNFEQQSVYLNKYYHLKDSLFTVDKTNQLTELESTYQIEKKNNELTKKDTELTKQRAQRNIFIIIALSIFVVLAGLAFFYSRIRKKNELLQQKNTQISEQKNELQTLNHVKDRLFSIISHDLRNPLVTLRSYLMLTDNDSLSAEKKHLFKVQTMNAVSQTGDMLDNLLAWANIQIKNTRANIIPLNCNDLVEDVVSNVKAQAFQKQINIVPQIAVETIPGDYDILTIALRNLLTNAIKFSSEKKEIKINCSQKADRILISVQDQGIGLSQDQIKNILDNKNGSTKGTQGEKGSGLGLFLIKELLQSIHAQLLIESEQGKGSTFIISLPAL